MNVSEDSTTPTPTPGSIKPSAMPKPTAVPAAAEASGTPAAAPAAPIAPVAESTSNAASFGRVGEDGTVYVKTPDGEKAVGSYPGKSEDEALAYFARKYDELADVPLSARQRADIADIQRQERENGCAR